MERAIYDLTKNKLDTPIDVTGYTDQLYEVHCDGYLFINSESMASTSVQVIIYNYDNLVSMKIFCVTAIDGYGSSGAIFIKKGMKFKIIRVNKYSSDAIFFLLV